MFEPAKKLLCAFAKDESGATSIEYGLIAVGIAVVIVPTVITVGDTMKQLFYGKITLAFSTASK